MPRQTAFPGIWIEFIEVEKPPFDKPGVVQEFVGRGAIREFNPLQKAEELSEENIQEMLEDVEESIGPLRDTFKIKYTLLVRSSPEVSDSRASKVGELFRNRSISSRARVYVRAKNPFEPEVIEVSSPVKDESLSSDKVGDVYRVTASVTK